MNKSLRQGYVRFGVLRKCEQLSSFCVFTDCCYINNNCSAVILDDYE